MTDELVLIDSNILIYHFDVSNMAKHKKAKEILDACWIREKKYAVSLQNLSEFFVSITQKIENPLSVAAGANVVKNLISFEGLVKLVPTVKSVAKAVEWCAEGKTSYWDALIAATMIENSVFTILTENTKDFSKIREISAKNPFL